MKVSLASDGKLWDKNAPIAADGLVSSVCNIPLKHHTWRIDRVCCHASTGDIATADERGQVYAYSVANNSYSYVRLASTPVSALEYIQCRRSHLIIAYRHGTILVVDTESRSIVSNIQLSRPCTVTQIRTHPSTPVAAMVSADGEVSIWDLR
jgi:hypothetical protein